MPRVLAHMGQAPSGERAGVDAAAARERQQEREAHLRELVGGARGAAPFPRARQVRGHGQRRAAGELRAGVPGLGALPHPLLAPQVWGRL